MNQSSMTQPGWKQIPFTSRFVMTVMCFTKYDMGFTLGRPIQEQEGLKQAVFIVTGSLLRPKILLIRPNVRFALPTMSVPPHRRFNLINAQAKCLWLSPAVRKFLAFQQRSAIGQKIWFLVLRKSSARQEPMTLLTWIIDKGLERKTKNKGDQFRWKKYKKLNSGH